MALSHNWPGFMQMLQRIRYRDGQLGVATRNHYTEADWNISNRWLVEDITAELAGEHGREVSRNDRPFEVPEGPLRPDGRASRSSSTRTFTFRTSDIERAKLSSRTATS